MPRLTVNSNTGNREVENRVAGSIPSRVRQTGRPSDYADSTGFTGWRIHRGRLIRHFGRQDVNRSTALGCFQRGMQTEVPMHGAIGQRLRPNNRQV